MSDIIQLNMQICTALNKLDLPILSSLLAVPATSAMIYLTYIYKQQEIWTSIIRDVSSYFLTIQHQ
jgi:hypothetical protein